MSDQAVNQCCSLKTVCGRSLWYGVACSCFTTLMLSIIMLAAALLNVVLITTSETQLNSRPLLAFDLVFGLMVIFLSFYQLVITSILLWRTFKSKDNIFLCSLWYVSHLSILVIYGIMFCARIAVSIMRKRYFTTAITIVTGSIYEGLFIYFSIIFNSYIHSLDLDRYF